MFAFASRKDVDSVFLFILHRKKDEFFPRLWLIWFVAPLPQSESVIQSDPQTILHHFLGLPFLNRGEANFWKVLAVVSGMVLETGILCHDLVGA